VIIYDSMTLEQIHFHVSINRDSQLNCVPSSIFRLVSVVCVAACSTATATFTQSNRFFHSTKNKPTKPKNKSRAKKRKRRSSSILTLITESHCYHIDSTKQVEFVFLGIVYQKHKTNPMLIFHTHPSRNRNFSSVISLFLMFIAIVEN